MSSVAGADEMSDAWNIKYFAGGLVVILVVKNSVLRIQWPGIPRGPENTVLCFKVNPGRMFFSRLRKSRSRSSTVDR